MLKIIAIVIVVAIVAVLGFAATRPDTFRVQREIDIKAPPEKVFALIDDFHRWTVWSPWEKRDPAMKRTYGGPVSGKGANYAWDGSREVGAGRMEIVDSTSPSRIQIQLDFLKPFEAHNTAEFTLKPAGDVTHVSRELSDIRQMSGLPGAPVGSAGEGKRVALPRDVGIA